jgi:DNA-binding winged helix-turn-helix (wHTH) protein/tetratricopeptide (TPR) repeat protein
MPEGDANSPFRIGAWLVQPDLNRLIDGDRVVTLEPRVMGVLLCLASRPLEIVSADDLFVTVWQGRVHTDNTIYQAVKELRKCLGDNAHQPQYIETIAKKGYRLVCPVSSVAEYAERTAKSTHWPEAIPRSKKRRRFRLGLIVAGGLALILLSVTIPSWYTVTEAPFDPKHGLAFEERDWVLISNFENRTGETLFDGSLEYALEHTLVNSRFVNVVSRDRIRDTLRLMKQPADARIDAALGREISLRDGGIRALLAGRIEKFGKVISLNVQIVDPIRGVTVSSLTEEAQREDQIWPAIQRIASRVRESLGEDLTLIPQSEHKLVKVTTPSLLALQLYSQADSVRARSTHRNHVVEQLLKQAINKDPEFASAYIYLAWSIHNYGNPSGEFLPYAKVAFELSDQLPDRERYFIRGSYFQMVGEDEKMLASYETLLRIHPDHFWAIVNIRGQLESLGRYEEAAAFAARCAQLRPKNFMQNYWAWDLLDRNGKPNEAFPFLLRGLALVGEEERENFGYWVARLQINAVFYVHWRNRDLQLLQKELEVLVRALDSAKGIYRSGLALSLGWAYLHLGQWRKADYYYNISFEASPIMYQRRRVFAAARSGDFARIPELMKDRKTWGSPYRAYYLAVFGFVDEARKSIVEAEAWLKLPDRPSNYRASYLVDLARGLVAFKEGRPDETISRLEPVVQQLHVYWMFHQYFYLTEVLASAHVRQGNAREAIRVLERAGNSERQPAFSRESHRLGGLRVQLRLAGLYRQSGRESEARALEDRVRARLAYADKDLWMVRYLEGDGKFEHLRIESQQNDKLANASAQVMDH